MCVYIHIICRHTLQSKQSVVARDVSHVGVNEFHVRSNEGERVCVVFVVVVDIKASDCNKTNVHLLTFRAHNTSPADDDEDQEICR